MERMRDSASLRRNLKPGQRAAIVLEFTELVESLREEARKQMLSTLKKGTEVSAFPNLAKRETQQIHIELAEKAGIGKSSMSYLMAVQRDEPELFSKVKSGGH